MVTTRCLNVNEIWKDIEGYEDLYQISNLGRVKSLTAKKIMKLRDNGYGYLTIGLFKNSKITRVKVHRLVAKAFVENSGNNKYVNHIDGDKHNNVSTNLEWCTRSYNMIHAYEHNLKKCVAVDQYDNCGKFIKTWKGAKYVFKDLKIHNSNIVKCCKGERQSAGGYIWRYHNKGGGA